MRNTLSMSLTLVVFGMGLTPATASSCAEQIGTINRRLDSSGAVKVTGPQDGHVIRSGSPRGLSAAPSGPPSDPHLTPTAARVSDARVLIARAVQEDRTGDQRACENTMSEAKGAIGALP